MSGKRATFGARWREKGDLFKPKSLRVGQVVGDKIYLGDGCWRRINVEESRMNDRRDGDAA